MNVFDITNTNFTPFIFSNLMIDKFNFYPLMILFIICFLIYINKNKIIFKWLSCIFLYSGIFLLSGKFTDEVFVNLEHTYNLFHHGIFSFSPTQKVVGTVEFIYHLLLLPFSLNQVSLVYGAILLSYIVGFLNIVMIYKIAFVLRINKTISLFLAAGFYPMINIFSTGFGNSLVSLVFLCIIYIYFNKNKISVPLATLLPLIRPESILYLFPVMVQDFIKKKTFKLVYLVPFISLALYFISVNFYYGQFIPTPILIKSSVEVTLKILLGNLLHLMLDPFIFFSIIILVLFLFISKKSNQNILKQYPYLFIFAYLVGILLFIKGQNLRYCLPLFPLHLLLVAYALGSLNLIEKIEELTQYKKNICYGSILLIIIFFNLFSISRQTYDEFIMSKALKNNSFISQRINIFAWAGYYLDKLNLYSWQIAAHEVNTQGFFNNYNYIDLYGYTNLETLNKKNSGLFRDNLISDLTNNKLIDIYFIDLTYPVFNKKKYSYEKGLTKIDYDEYFKYIKDININFSNYELFLINFHPKYKELYFPFIVKKERSEEFHLILYKYGAIKNTTHQFHKQYSQFLSNSN